MGRQVGGDDAVAGGCQPGRDRVPDAVVVSGAVDQQQRRGGRFAMERDGHRLAAYLDVFHGVDCVVGDGAGAQTPCAGVMRCARRRLMLRSELVNFSVTPAEGGASGFVTAVAAR